MPALAAVDTSARANAEARLSGAGLAERTLPRAVWSPDPLIRLIGWMLTAEGGSWTGTTSEMMTRLREEAAGRDGDFGLGTTASTFGRTLMARRADLAAIGITAEQTRVSIAGVDRRRWTLSTADIRPLTKAPSSPLFDLFIDRHLVACDFDERETVDGFYAVYCAFALAAGTAGGHWPLTTFAWALKREAEKVGAYPVTIDGRKGWKGLRLARPQPSAATPAIEDAARREVLSLSPRFTAHLSGSERSERHGAGRFAVEDVARTFGVEMSEAEAAARSVPEVRRADFALAEVEPPQAPPRYDRRVLAAIAMVGAAFAFLSVFTFFVHT